VYDRARRVNWRSSWGEDATGVWVRGGHPDDQHDHADRGHVNYIFKGRPILIEAGTPAYHNPLIGSHYASGFGHNVLQVGTNVPGRDVSGAQSPHCTAALTVLRLDDKGGAVTVDPTASYKEGVSRWIRHVAWDADQLTTRDEVTASSSAILCFRWHLGTEAKPEIVETKEGFKVSWADAVMTLAGDVKLEVSQESMPDHTLQSRKWEDPDLDHWHTCLVVRTAKPETQAQVTMQVRGKTPAVRSPRATLREKVSRWESEARVGRAVPRTAS